MGAKPTGADMATYRAAWQQRELEERRALERRTSEARALATAAARTLKEEFGARRVWLFGSLARGTFGRASDVDLAVDGMDARRFYAALGHLLGMDPEITVDLVDLAAASPHMRRAIEAEGVPL